MHNYEYSSTSNRYGLSWNPNLSGHLLSASDDHVRNLCISKFTPCTSLWCVLKYTNKLARKTGEFFEKNEIYVGNKKNAKSSHQPHP